MGSCLSMSAEQHTLVKVPRLPDQVIVGYAHDENVIEAVREGVNVLIWFSIDLTDGDVQRGPKSLNKMRSTIRTLHRERYTDLIHLICIGGWNAKHIHTKACSPEEYFARWKIWNQTVVADPEVLPFGFHGFDWDLEGNDDPDSVYNTFTIDCLDYMGKLSKLAKADGYLVTMAPAQSYLDPDMPEFSRRLNHTDSNWEHAIPGLNFAYHGHNCYAYLLAKYGVETFDFITVQVYEGYARTLYKVRFGGKQPSDALVELVQTLVTPWTIKFSSDPATGLPDSSVHVPPSKVVIGLANAWAGGPDGKFILIQPEEVEKAYQTCIAKGFPVRGFAYWNIAEEGRNGLWLSTALNKFMKIRTKKEINLK